MIIPSIDLIAGRAVQLEGGESLRIDAGDPRPIADRFGVLGEVAVIDLDAARGEGSNAAVIAELLPLARCRVGGGIRTYEDAVRWLDAGAQRIIIGTAATPDLLRRLPRQRLIAALDSRNGLIVDRGWRRETRTPLAERIVQLREYVSGFLFTFVEHEGTLKGLPMERIADLVTLAAPASVTVAGGLANAEEVGEVDRLGADVQVGMALYSGRITLADAFAACIRGTHPDGLWPTVVCDEGGSTLVLVWSSPESLRLAVESRRGIYWSRSRNSIWTKGDSSGNQQELLHVALDCDRDALRFTVRQHGSGFCHLPQQSCFGDRPGIHALARTIADRVSASPPGSYTARVINEPGLLAAKLLEEAAELAEATTQADVIHEAADLLYFTLTAVARAGVTLPDVERELARRALRLTRRPGNAKPIPEIPT